MGDGTEFTSEEIANIDNYPNDEELDHIEYRFIKAVAQSGLARMIRDKGVTGMSKEESDEFADKVDILTNRKDKERDMKKNIIQQLT